MTKVSLIVPVYRAEPWIAECMASIRAKTYKDIELIVIDDAQGSGAAAARNRGLDQATGEFVAFCDADDYLEPNAIRDMMDHIGFGADMVCGSFRKFGNFEAIVTAPTGAMQMRHVAEYAMSNLLDPRNNQMLSGCWAKLFRRNLVGRFPLIQTAEDMAFNFDCLTRCGHVKFISDLVYHNRKRNGSLTTTFNEGDKPALFGFLQGLKYVKRFLSPFYKDEQIDDAIDNSKMYHGMLYFSRICAQDGGTMRDVLRKLYP